MIDPAATSQPLDGVHDAALARLDDLATLPVEDHVAVYEEIQASLQDALQEAALQEAALQEAALQEAAPQETAVQEGALQQVAGQGAAGQPQ